MSINYEEKRDFIRMNTEHALQFKEIGSDKVQHGVCRNLSATGIMFISEQEIPQGTKLAVTITPQYSVVSPFNVVIKVVRTHTNGTSSPYTIAGTIISTQ